MRVQQELRGRCFLPAVTDTWTVVADRGLTADLTDVSQSAQIKKTFKKKSLFFSLCLKTNQFYFWWDPYLYLLVINLLIRQFIGD